MNRNLFSSGRRVLAALLLVPLSAAVSASGASLKQANIAAVVGEVNLVTSGTTLRAASVGDKVGVGTEVTTGSDSRVELSFNDQAIARLSTNARLGFNTKHVLELGHGSVLLQFPSGIKGKVQAGEVAATLSRATALFEYQPTVFKFLVLEGTVRLYRPGKLGDSVLVRAGQMIFGNTNAGLSDPVDFDIDRFVKTCPLIQTFARLRSEELIAVANERQQRARSKKALTDTNLVIFGGGMTVSVLGDSAKTTPDSHPNSTAEVRQ